MLAEDGLVLQAEINVTPLVDVALVLLIIFIVITPLLRQSYDVATPQIRAGRPAVQSEIVVSVGSQGVVFLNREPMTRAELATRLGGLLRGRSAKTVFLPAEDGNSYGEVIAVMDLVRNACAARIGAVLTTSGEARP